jgi:outer membrane protein assembly factor BamB
MNELRNTQAYSPPGRLDWPTDVERLPNGNTLITDAGYWSGQGSEIIEVDHLGNIVWRYDTGLRFAHSAKLMPNGNILITDTSNNRIIEINRYGQLIFSSDEWSGGSGNLSDGSRLSYPNDAHFMSSGNFVITDRNNNRVVEADRKGKIIKQFKNLKHPHNGEFLSNGNLLFANSDANLVQEVDLTGKIVWSYGNSPLESLNWPRDADRLSNGNTLITDSKNHRVIEVTPENEIVWTYQMDKHGHLYEADRLSNGNTLISVQQRFKVIEVDPAGNIVWSFKNYYRPEPLFSELKNPDFEQEAFPGANSPADWYPCDLVSEGGANFIWDSQIRHSGNHSIGIEYTNPGAVWWQQIVQVKPEQNYRISGYIKTEALDGFSQIQLSFLDEEGCSLHAIRQLPGGKQFQGTNDWTKDVFECRSHQEAKALEIRLMVVGKGKVWFDKFTLEVIAGQEIMKDAVSKDRDEEKKESSDDRIRKRLEQLGYLG